MQKDVQGWRERDEPGQKGGKPEAEIETPVNEGRRRRDNQVKKETKEVGKATLLKKKRPRSEKKGANAVEKERPKVRKKTKNKWVTKGAIHIEVAFASACVIIYTNRCLAPWLADMVFKVYVWKPTPYWTKLLVKGCTWGRLPILVGWSHLGERFQIGEALWMPYSSLRVGTPCRACVLLDLTILVSDLACISKRLVSLGHQALFRRGVIEKVKNRSDGASLQA